MNFIDLIIIYLACGSPFAVFQATNRQKGRAGVNWPRVAASFFLWPAFAAILLASKLFPNEASKKAEFQSRIEDIRLDLEQAAFAEASISSLFDFRETFYRFAGLSEAADEVQPSRSTAEIFDVTGHNNKALATRCLGRKNARKLAFHRTAAREEFVGLISQLTLSSSDSIEITNVASELADHLNDKIAADAFRSMNSAAAILPDGHSTSGLEKEVWRSTTHSTSTIN
ncbi:MAG: hypothetical protein QM785_12175 [Pyrinomonadaceae bacterium]